MMRKVHVTFQYVKNDGSIGLADTISDNLDVAGGMALTQVAVEQLRKMAIKSVADCKDAVLIGWHVLANESYPRPI